MLEDRPARDKTNESKSWKGKSEESFGAPGAQEDLMEASAVLASVD